MRGEERRGEERRGEKGKGEEKIGEQRRGEERRRGGWPNVGGGDVQKCEKVHGCQNQHVLVLYPTY